MVSSETGLAASFDPQSGENVKWSVPLGSQSYSTPIVSQGRVFVGTNNGRPRDPRHKGDRGVLLCLDEDDGALRWQLVVPKLEQDQFLDWPRVGLVSPPSVEGDRLYLVSNRGAVLCLDIDGHADGNDGPFVDEGRFMARPGAGPMEIGDTDADIVWRYDMREELGVRLHDEAHASVLIDGPFLWICTSNGVDGSHKYILAPKAPSLIVLEKATGRLLAKDDLGIGPDIVHCTWSSPALGSVGGRKLVFFGGANAICYAFEPLASMPAAGQLAKLNTVWKFDCDPEGPRGDLAKYQDNRRVGPSTIIGMPVFHDGRVYVTCGGDLWHGKTKTWIECLDASKKGDVTKSARIWSQPLVRHCMSTPAVAGGLVFVPDCGRHLHCFDARTGEPQWSHDTLGEIWGSALVADGKVFVGTRRARFYVFAAEREKKILASVKLDSAISGSPTAANGVVYVSTMARLYAIAPKAR